jgi:hypothetical protein
MEKCVGAEKYGGMEKCVGAWEGWRGV